MAMLPVMTKPEVSVSQSNGHGISTLRWKYEKVWRGSGAIEESSGSSV